MRIIYITFKDVGKAKNSTVPSVLQRRR